jgi:hypothetical protein
MRIGVAARDVLADRREDLDGLAGLEIPQRRRFDIDLVAVYPEVPGPESPLLAFPEPDYTQLHGIVAFAIAQTGDIVEARF